MNIKSIRNKNIPDSPGIYIFRDYKRRPIYIGRATSLYDRTRSYFSNDLIKTRGPRIVDMVTKAKYITWQKTVSVLEAILLESLLIKRYQPIYNIDEKDDKSGQYVVITDEEWPRVFLVRARDLDQANSNGILDYKIKKIFGPFNDSGLIKDVLKILRKIFPFRDKKSFDLRHDSFYRTIGRSPLIGSDSLNRSYLETIEYLIMFFEGNAKVVRKLIEGNIKSAIKDLRFEDAQKFTKLLYALEHINDINLIKRNNSDLVLADNNIGSGFRIEAYDIAHISGTNVVGVMVASIDGQLSKNQYRKFKITIDQNNDLAGLAEIISRRFAHSEWAYPDLIVVDGNERQVEITKKILQIRRINIPIVAVTKNHQHKASSFVGDKDIVNKYQKEIVKVNLEAHRFALKYHRQRRSKF